MHTPDPHELADREAIREVANRYVHGIDRLDGDWMKSAYWPEAIDDHGTFVGPAWEFVDRCITSHAWWAWTMHTTTNHQIDVDPDGVSAFGESYNVSLLMSADRSTLNTWYGRYLDRYEKRGEEWRIIHRVCVHEGSLSQPVAQPMPIDSTPFRPGSFDRSSGGRRLGP